MKFFCNQNPLFHALYYSRKGRNSTNSPRTGPVLLRLRDIWDEISKRKFKIYHVVGNSNRYQSYLHF